MRLLSGPTPAITTTDLIFRTNLANWAPTLAALGDLAARRADEIAGLGFDPTGDTYDAACALSLCVPPAAKDEKLQRSPRVAVK